MKKILTVLLSFLMVATLGIVNVSAENKTDKYDEGGIEYTVTYDNSAKKYNGTDQTLFNINISSCSGDDKCMYELINDSTHFDWGTPITKVNTEAKATTPGTYYLHVDATHNYSGGNVSHDWRTYGTVTISKADAPKVSITAPTEDGKKGDTPYYIVGDGQVELPFKISYDSGVFNNDTFTTTWKRVDASGNEITDANNITIDSNTGKLTIKSALPSGVYDITIKVEAKNENYNDASATKTIKIVKANDYVVTFNGNISDGNNNVVYGKNAKEIVDSVSKVIAKANDQEFEVNSSFIASDSKKVEQLNNANYEVIFNSNILDVSSYDKTYRISLSVKHKYGDGDEDFYTYNVNDYFKVVEKDAEVKLIPNKNDDGSNYVYDGKEHYLTGIEKGSLKPSGDGSTEAAKVYYKVVKVSDSATLPTSVTASTYKDLTDGSSKVEETESSIAKEAGRYFIYYRVDRGSDTNYKDFYSVIENTINKAKATIEFNCPETITYGDDSDLYYVVSKESGTVTLPFTVSAKGVDDASVNTTEFTATIKDSNGIDVSSDYISFSNGTLTINANNESLAAGKYTVTLSAKADDSNYDSTAQTKTVYIEKVDTTTDYKFGFKDDFKLEYGVTAKTLLDNIKTITFTNSTDTTDDDLNVAPIKDLRTIESLTVKEKYSATEYGNALSNTATLKANTTYLLSATIKHTYTCATENEQTKTCSYNYVVTDEISIAKKDATAKVEPVKDSLVYSGTAQTLVTYSDLTPKNDSSAKQGATIYFKVVEAGEEETKPETVDADTFTNVSGDAKEWTADVTPQGTNAGGYFVYYHVTNGGNNGYQDSYGVEEKTIEKAPLTVTGLSTDDPITYNGEEHKPTINVTGWKNNETPFELVTYATSKTKAAYKDAGEWTTTIAIPETSKEGQANPKNYKLADNTVTEGTLTIKPKDIASEDVTVTAPANVTYSGKEQKKEPTVNDTKISGITLDTDYTLSYSQDVTNAGEVTVTITGKDNYKGTRTTKYSIEKAPLTVTGLNATSETTFNGEVQKPQIEVEGWVNNEAAFELATYETNDTKTAYKDAGEWTTTIAIPETSEEGQANPKNYKLADNTVTEGTLTIKPKDIASEDVTVTAPANVTYSGKEQKKEPTVNDTSISGIAKGTDYTLSYSKDVTNAGEVTVTITGKDNYTGTRTATYSITPKTLTVSGLVDTPVAYNGQSHKPVVKVEGIVNNEINVVTYASDAKAYTNAGTWTTNVAIPLGNNNYVFAKGTTTSATLTVSKAESKIIASATTSTYYKNNGGRATLKADGIKSDFVKLQIKNSSGEWEDVAASNYEVKEGSTIVELRQTYLTSKTSDGKDRFEYDKDYTFRFVYDDNYSNAPETTLKIRKYTAPSNNSSSSTTTKKVVNTATH